MIRPRLRIKGTPNYEKGEIGPDDISYAELREVAFVAIRKVVPPLPATFPADPGEPDKLGTGGDVPPGEAVQREAEQLA
jgi:hypothetical protein